MNKTELIDAIAKDSGLSRADSARSLESLINTVQKTLKRGDDVAITGFGKFSVTKRGARTGRNPATGAAIKIKASKAPKFTAGDPQNNGQRQEDLTRPGTFSDAASVDPGGRREPRPSCCGERGAPASVDAMGHSRAATYRGAPSAD